MENHDKLSGWMTHYFFFDFASQLGQRLFFKIIPEVTIQLEQSLSPQSLHVTVWSMPYSLLQIGHVTTQFIHKICLQIVQVLLKCSLWKTLWHDEHTTVSEEHNHLLQFGHWDASSLDIDLPQTSQIAPSVWKLLFNISPEDARRILSKFLSLKVYLKCQVGTKRRSLDSIVMALWDGT